MNELAYFCTIYLKTEPDEDIHKASERLERILLNSGLDYQMYNVELRDPEGNVIEED